MTTAVKEWPVPFRPHEVRAVLAGRKTLARRVVSPSNSTVLGYPAKPYWPDLKFDHAIPRAKASVMEVMVGTEAAPPDPHLSAPYQYPGDPTEGDVSMLPWYRVRPKWEVGDRLWVKETWSGHFIWAGEPASTIPNDGHTCVYYRADGESPDAGAGGCTATQREHRWRPSIFMPRWASRITLEIVDVRAEQLHDITEKDAKAEGFEGVPFKTLGPETHHAGHREAFAAMWDSINRKAHPWSSNPWVWRVAFRRIPEGGER